MNSIRPEINTRMRFAEKACVIYLAKLHNLTKFTEKQVTGNPICCVHMNKVVQAKRIFDHYRKEHETSLELINGRKFSKKEGGYVKI